MGAIGSIIGDAVGAAIGGGSRGTSLQDFLSNFSASQGVLVKTIDPYCTFDVLMKLYPGPEPANDEDKSWLSKLGDSLVSSAKSAVQNAANNLTGGLLGSLLNSNNKNLDVMTKHNTFEQRGQETFLEYLAAAHMLVSPKDEGWFGEKAGETVRPLEIQLGLYCQEVVIPNIDVQQGGSSTNALGEFPITGSFIKPDSPVLQLKLINTVAPLHERLFYPWLRETTLPFWSYTTQPYTTATIIVDFTKHSDTKYVFCGCRPTKINMQQPHQDSNPSMTRDVSFLYDAMFVYSDLKTYEKPMSKLLDAGKKLFDSASKMMNG